MFETPILLLVFNRPDLTQLVLDQIKVVRPKYLYVASDGPRSSTTEDKQKCKEVREVIQKTIDWPCELKTLYREENLGCGKAVSEAISWFFNDVEYGIIIEDDIYMNTDFFHFMDEMLARFKNDSRVFSVSGCNYQLVSSESRYSYFYTKYISIWGWGTWKRVWDRYIFNMSPEQFEEYIYLYRYSFQGVEADKRIKDIQRAFLNQIDTWDYQLMFTCIRENGLNIIPSKNLVKNIGFGSEATHTKDAEHKFSNLEIENLEFPLRHPNYFILNTDYENKLTGKSIQNYSNMKKKIFSFKW